LSFLRVGSAGANNQLAENKTCGMRKSCEMQNDAQVAMTPPWKQHLDSLQINDLNDVFRTTKPVIGMVHCWPLPGAPGYSGYGMTAIIDNALRDAEVLVEVGVDGLIVENMWDIPFRAGPNIQPESIAAHAVVAAAVRRAFDLRNSTRLARRI
jgi:hypothetical protein